jgi:alpha-tubulin suppressor-like RCC1 family protein
MNRRFQGGHRRGAAGWVCGLLMLLAGQDRATAQPATVEAISGWVNPFAIHGWGAAGTSGTGGFSLNQVVNSPTVVGSSVLWAGNGAHFYFSLGGVPAVPPDVTAIPPWTALTVGEVSGFGSGAFDVSVRAVDVGLVEQFRRCAQVVGIACGEFHTVMVRRDGTVSASGWNRVGQVDVPASATNVVAVACGLDHSLAVRADGTAVAWGRPVSEPLLPPPAENRGFIAAAGGARHSVFLRKDGRVVVAGERASTTLAPPRSLTNAIAVSAGAYHGIALTADHRTVEWGRRLEDDGVPPQYDDDLWPRTLPAPGVVAVSAGGFFNLALRSNGTVYAWGGNEFGELDVPACATNVVAISAGTYHALALRADGTVVAWGVADTGITDIPPGLDHVVAIAAGGYHNQVLVQTQPVLTWPRVEGSRFRAELNLPAGMRYRLESLDGSGRWKPLSTGPALPGNLTLDLPADSDGRMLVRAVPLAP